VAALLALICLGSGLPVAEAHTIRPAVVTVVFADDASFAVTARVSAETLLAGIGPEYTDTNDSPNAARYDELRALPPDELRAEFERFVPEFLQQVRMEFDGVAADLEFTGIDVPPVGDLEVARDSTVFLRGQRPPQAQTMTWAWPREFGSNVLRATNSSLDSAVSAWLQPGEVSEPFTLGSSEQRSRLEIIRNYVIIGFEHIVPKGLDHILFVLGLFLLSLQLSPLLWQVSAFTVAHTITLGLTIYGIVALPASVVEPLIALSIAYVGIENLMYDRLKPWRVVLVFVFGLLHGMGFAGVLNEIGLPENEYLTALLAFNVGVEFGQLSVILGAFLVVGWFRHKTWYRQWVVMPLSLGIAAMGLYWTGERLLG
jgi:hydrogenase/urease accessory protein HupE